MGIQKIFRGGGGGPNHDLKFQQAKKNRGGGGGGGGEGGKVGRGVVSHGVNQVIFPYNCLYLFISSFFQHSIRTLWRRVLGFSQKNLSKTGSFFCSKIHHLSHKMCHWGKGLNKELNYAQTPSLWISNNSMIFYNKMFDKTMQTLIIEDWS